VRERQLERRSAGTSQVSTDRRLDEAGPNLGPELVPSNAFPAQFVASDAQPCRPIPPVTCLAPITGSVVCLYDGMTSPQAVRRGNTSQSFE